MRSYIICVRTYNNIIEQISAHTAYALFFCTVPAICLKAKGVSMRDIYICGQRIDVTTAKTN